jgi:hypothetical protein
VHSVEVMLMRGGEDYRVIACELPDAGYYCWNVSNDIKQSNGYKEGVWLRGGTEIISDYEKRLEMQRSLRDAKGYILKRAEIMKFLDPEYQIRVRVKYFHNGKEPLIADGWNPTKGQWEVGADYIENFSAHFFIVQLPQQEARHLEPKKNADIRLLFPKGKDLLWTVGTQQTIKWQTDGWIHTVCVSLLSGGIEVAIIEKHMLNLGVLIYCMPSTMMAGDHYQIRVRSKQDARVVAESDVFRVVEGDLAAAASTYSVNGGVPTSFRRTTKPVTALLRKKMLLTRKAFGEEPHFVGELRPLDLELRRTDGTFLPQIPDFVKKCMKPQWDSGRGPQRLESYFVTRPEMKTANDKDLFEVFRPRIGPDKLDVWTKEQEDFFNAWRQEKIKRVMAENGVEGEIKDWKNLMDEWEVKNNPELAKAIVKQKEKVEREIAASKSFDLWEMMVRTKFKFALSMQ